MASPPKRPRLSFSIESLLADTPRSSSSSSPARYVRRLDCGIEVNDRFKTAKICSKFIIEHLPPNPEGLLRGIFARCIENAVQIAEEKQGSKPDRVGVMISSPLLEKGNVYVPIRPIHEDTVENVLNCFLRVVQSRDKEGRDSIFGQPFTVIVHTVNVAALPARRQIKGRGRIRRNAPAVHHNINATSLIAVNNPDNRCLFYALELTRQHHAMDSPTFSNYYNHHQRQQTQDVQQLMQGAGIPLDLADYDATLYVKCVVDYWNERHAAEGIRYKVFIFGELGNYHPDYMYGPDDFNVPIPIFHSAAAHHFHGVRNPGAMFRLAYKYCFSCLMPYRKDADHTRKCKAKCQNCGRVGAGRPCPPENAILSLKCGECSRIYRNMDCYQHHKDSNDCARIKKCEDCGMCWSVKDLTRDGRGGHICGERWCQRCNKFHNPDRGCFIRTLDPKPVKPYRIISFDFECTQHEALADQPQKRLHAVNFASAIVLCTFCVENGRWRHSLRGSGCQVCGNERSITFSVRGYRETQVDRQEVTSDPLRAFLNWLTYELPVKYTSVAFSHYGGKYDMVIVFRELYASRLTPSMIRRGNKLYEMRVPKVKKMVTVQGRQVLHESAEVIFRDTYNILPVALGQLVSAFGLQTQEKQWFPHMANHPHNYDRTISLPPKDDYLYGGMTPAKQKAFDEWYAAAQACGTTFNLNEMLAAYCVNDTLILAEALVVFRKEFAEISKGKVDATWHACTLAGLCMKHYQANHLKADHLAIVPTNSYEKCDTQSNLALKFFKWYEQEHGVEIQTAHSAGGEHRVDRFKLDGYIAAEGRAIEVNGCHIHACECTYKPGDEQFVLPTVGKTVEEVRRRDAARLEYLNSKLRGGVEVVWQCEIEKKIRRIPSLRAIFAKPIEDGPIRIRDAFFGGRTGPLCLFYERQPGYKMIYVDFCSLYPFITAITAFPIGHPVLHVIKKLEQVVNWTRPEDIPVKGILKVFIVPPKKCIVPVVPAKFDGRLLFPLCYTCAIEHPQGGVMREYSCPHQDDEARGWVATLASIELAEALSEDGGYRVTRYYRSLEYKDFDDTVFRDYVAEMMEMKIHASGFPEGIETLEQQQQFINECLEKFGIRIAWEKMSPNQAKRLIAKLMNNNLWGKFSMREGLAKTTITDSPAVFREVLEKKGNQIVQCDELSDFIMMITTEEDDEFIEEVETSNIVLSLWTTAAARIHLLKAMRQVVKSGAKLLYTDTDSLIFAYKESDPCPLPTGPHLGDLTDEYPQHEIVEFCSGGCKQYQLVMQHKVSGEEKTIQRIRGITMTADVCKEIHRESFRDAVLWYCAPAEVEMLDGRPLNELDPELWTLRAKYPNFLRASIRDGHVCSTELEKRYKPVVSKGIVTKGYIVKDFGSS